MMDNSITYLISEIEESGVKLQNKLNNIGVEVTFGKKSENKTDLSEIIDISIEHIGAGGECPQLEEIINNAILYINGTGS